MAATWNHPKLGRFEYGDGGPGWGKVVDVPAFKAFSYDTGYPDAPRSNGKRHLVFTAAGMSELPPPAEIAVADKVLANQTALVRVVSEALWEDFNGRGPASGMWWCGDLQGVAKYFKSHKLPGPAKPEDLLPAMQLSALLVRDGFPGHGAGPMVELSFHTAFEEEHGVSVLTDGQAVLGIGFNLDLLPFGFEPQNRPPFGRSR